MDFFSKFLQSAIFVEVNAYIKIGIYDFKDLSTLFLYSLPEIAILCMLMLHDIKLQLIGLSERNEDDVEKVIDAIERNIQ